MKLLNRFLLRLALISLVVLAGSAGVSSTRAADSSSAFRPPAVPLVTFDPFLSVWSKADRLTDTNTRHWTRHEHALASLIRVDGKTYRLMGADPNDVPAFNQASVQVLPTRTIYEFEDAGVHVTLTFMRPALPHDIEVFSWPLNYITWTAKAVDGAKHDVSIYDSTSSELVVNEVTEPVEWSREKVGDLTALRVGTHAQPVLGSAGDDHRINWGYVYVAARTEECRTAMGGNRALLEQFATDGSLPGRDDERMPRAVNDDTPALAVAFSLGRVGDQPVQRQVLIAYDEIFAIKYFGKDLRPYWSRNGMKPARLMRTAENQYPSLLARCEAFDRDLMSDMTRMGGERYALITALSYRQCAAACGLAADPNKQPLFLTKENTSNGDIGTVDVFFPMDPIWVFLSPSLTKATLAPILVYASSSHWRFPNAPHDLGTYPIARGTDDGGEGMPVEESGNMLILCDAVAQAEGNANFVRPWWPKLTQWAEYLKQYGLDPEEQLCTDDFMGHLAHNANLSVKAILGLAAYGDLCRMRGDTKTAQEYAALAKTDAEHWVKVADDGDHYRLAFDKPGTWSQKYNLVWDRILGLNVFPASVAEKEVAYYKKVMQRYGVPLDSRTHLTKTDWSIWSATLAERPGDFEAIISPIYDYLNHTTVRDPISDSYETDKLDSGGMHARPVVGGFFIKMLTDRELWKKWASGDKMKVGGWADLPAATVLEEVIPSSRETPSNWRYTTHEPSGEWAASGFDDHDWKEGPAGFGTEGTPGIKVRTTWDTADIWLRREFTMPKHLPRKLQFYVYHDEDVEVYVNGLLAGTDSGFTTGYVPVEINRDARALLKPGARVTIAVHCHQTGGGQGVDLGFATPSKSRQTR